MPPPAPPFLSCLSTTVRIAHIFLGSSSSFKSSFSSSALAPSKSKSCKWNSNSSLIITNPVLVIMESCDSMSQLKQIQAHMTRTGLISHLFPVSRLLSFCALSHSGDVNHAHLVFTQISEPNVYICNTMIRGYCKFKAPKSSFLFLQSMVRVGMEMDNRTFVFALKACEQFPGIFQGQELHCLIYKLGFDLDLLVQNGLIHFYIKHGSLVYARYLFDKSFHRDVVSWTTMISGYTQKSLPYKAVELFRSMLSSYVEPNEVTMITVLSACSLIGDLSLGRWIHDYIEKNNVNRSLNLLNALVDMYAKCGCLTTAREIFNKMEIRDVFTWTSMVDGYAKEGDIDCARFFFDEMPERNIVSWNAMIAGYSQNNQPKEALLLFKNMEQAADIDPIEATLVCVLSACSQLGCLDLGRWIHQYYIEQGRVQLGVTLTNALVDMYAKCGSIVEAAKLFSEMPKRDLVSWNSMIVGYAAHGYARHALNLYDDMKSGGFQPDDITFIGLLSACTHGGLAIQGREYFESMRKEFSLEPKVEHYACMIDLLGRVGHLEEAYELIKTMPMEPDEATWGALLNGCSIHKNVELGTFSAGKLLDLNPNDSGIYALLANLYSSSRKWDDVRMVRSMMRGRGVKKTPGCSSIEVEGEWHEFLVADKFHPRVNEIYRMLDEMLLLLKLEGYVPDTSYLMILREAGDSVSLNK